MEVGGLLVLDVIFTNLSEGSLDDLQVVLTKLHRSGSAGYVVGLALRYNTSPNSRKSR